MKDLQLSGPFARFMVPRALFWGVGLSFAVFTAAGYLVAQRNQFQHFERFYGYIEPTTLFYPTPNQLRALGRKKLDPGKIAVVVGGSSRLYGARQRPTHMWTRRLQELLGDGYQVVNFGFPSATSWEMGAVAAEILSRDRSRLIFIADCSPAWIDRCPDGHYYRYFFWEAYYRGLLLDDPEREKRLKEVADEPRRQQDGRCGGDNQALKLRAWLDSLLYFDDLWNTCAYRWFCTVWTPRTRLFPMCPRRKLQDPEAVQVPIPDPYPVPLREGHMKAIKVPIQAHCCLKDASGNWVENPNSPAWLAFQQNADACFPEALHAQTLLVVSHWSCFYMNQLTPDERAYVAEAGRLSVKRLEAIGYSAVENGPELSLADFADAYHLSESGGAKLAKQVAAKVQGMALRLGYLD